METKKTIKANLEKTKTTNLLMGAIVALAVLFVSFEWGTTKVNVFEEISGSFMEPDMLPITFPEPPAPPPLPPAKVEVATTLKEVENEAKTSDIEILGTEETGTPSPAMPPVEVPIKEEKPDENEIFIIVETMPEYPGGNAALMRYLAQSVNYPVVAQENGIQGRVTVSFVINKDGSIVDAEIVRGIDASLDKEALRVINSMPKWKPGMQRDKTVRVKYTLPINFKLQN